MVDYRILGPLEVSADGRVIEILLPKNLSSQPPIGSISTPHQQLPLLRTSALQTAAGNPGGLGRSDGLLGMTLSCLSVAGIPAS